MGCDGLNDNNNIFPPGQPLSCSALHIVLCSAPSVAQPVFKIMEKAPTRAFSGLKVPTIAFIFNVRILTPAGG